MRAGPRSLLQSPRVLLILSLDTGTPSQMGDVFSLLNMRLGLLFKNKIKKEKFFFVFFYALINEYRPSAENVKFHKSLSGIESTNK